jgi:chromosome partitioning protein
MKMILCVNNNKGGVLKTTTVTNLAGVAAAKQRVLIIDTDNQSNVALSFGLNPDNFRTSLYDVLLGGVPAEDAIVSAYENIDILPSNNDLVSFEFDVLRERDRYPDEELFYIMHKALNHLRKKYDLILIDTPPSLGLMNGNVFAFADRVLIPYQPEPYSMRSLMAVVDTINDFKQDFNPNLEIVGVLRTLVNMQTNLHIDVMEETKKYTASNGLHIFNTVIPRTIQFASNVGYNRLPATLAKKRDKGELYFDVWNEIEKLIVKEVR